MLTLLKIELLGSLRCWQDSWLPMAFFLLVTTLFPLAIGTQQPLLQHIAPGVIFIAFLLALLLTLDHLFQREAEQGFLDQWRCASLSLPAWVTMKLLAFWITIVLPLLLITPLLALALGSPLKLLSTLILSLLLSTPCIIGLCACVSALTVQLRHQGLLLALLILPLLIPLLIFAVGAVQHASAGLPINGIMALLGGASLLTCVFTPFIVSAILKL